MYDFMYIDPEKMEREEYFPATKMCVVYHKKISTPGSEPKHWLGSSYICSKDYELDLNVHVTENKRK